MTLAKAALRQHFKQIRDHIHTSDRLHQQQQITKHLISSNLFQQAKVIGMYQPILSELSLELIIQAAVDNHKTLLLPQITDHKNKTMHYVDTNNHPIHPDKINLILVPCIACDKQCYRLGMGGGYFDRYIKTLSIKQKPYLLGIGFNEQLTEQLIHDTWDQPLDNMLTANGFIHPVDV